MFSAVTLLVSATAPGSTTPEIFTVRSNDSGATFYGDPVNPASLDVPQRTTAAGQPVMLCVIV